MSTLAVKPWFSIRIRIYYNFVCLYKNISTVFCLVVTHRHERNVRSKMESRGIEIAFFQVVDFKVVFDAVDGDKAVMFKTRKKHSN
jgi:hypothetical protein